jgi:hypothetical protein
MTPVVKGQAARLQKEGRKKLLKQMSMTDLKYQFLKLFAERKIDENAFA